MKKLIYLSLIIISFSCSKQEAVTHTELDISYKALKGVDVGASNEEIKITIYPNPFIDDLIVELNGAESAEFLFSDETGRSRQFVVEESKYAHFEFGSERPGVYYCEILIDNKVFRYQLVKEL